MEYQTMDKDYDNVEDEHDDDDDKKINNVVRSQIVFVWHALEWMQARAEGSIYFEKCLYYLPLSAACSIHQFNNVWCICSRGKWVREKVMLIQHLKVFIGSGSQQQCVGMFWTSSLVIYLSISPSIFDAILGRDVIYCHL